MIDIIAEIGAHHNCDLKRAFQLINLAKEAGANAVKFQMYKAERLVVKDGAAYWNEAKTQYEVFSSRDLLKEDEWYKIAKHCEDIEIEFLATPFDLTAVTNLRRLNVKRYKVASGDITNYPLLKSVAKTGKDIILSTGASTYTEIAETINYVKSIWRSDIPGREPVLTLLHCSLSYPSNLEQANLSRINKLKLQFPSARIGLSHHVIDDQMSSLYMSVGLGAKTIEVHFTDDRTLPGDDHAHSLDFTMLKKFIETTSSLLKPAEEIQACELSARSGARRSIVAKEFIRKGEELTEANLDCKRPGTGIPASSWDYVINKIAARDYQPDECLTWDGLR